MYNFKHNQFKISKYVSKFILILDKHLKNVFFNKGCPKKSLEYVFWSRGQKSKFQTGTKCAEILHGFVGSQYKLFWFSGPYGFRPLFQRYSLFKEKNANILEMEPIMKKCHWAKKSQNLILHLSRWSENFLKFF